MATKDISDTTVVEAYFEMWETLNGCETIYEILHRKTGQPTKVCHSAMERAARHELIDYGVSIRSAWLTSKGTQLLVSKLSKE